MTDYREFNDDDLDRLVDGELDEAEYKRLLSLLDDRPGGWRQLALAFLEERALTSELSALRQSADPRPAIAIPAQGKSWLPLALAAAASFLLAFWLGLAWNAGTPESARPQMAGTGRLPVEDSLPVVDSVPGETRVDRPGTSGSGPWGRVTLVMDRNDGSSEEIEVPVYRWEDAQGGGNLANSMSIPPELRSALQRAGYQVRRDLRWTPLEVDGGNRVFVPLGEFEITPVANPAY